MGNYRFKLSDMIPNAWFYKLRDMGRGRKQTTTTPSKKKMQSSSASTTHHSSKPNQPHHHHHQCNPRKSYYFTRDLTPNNNNNNKLYSSPSNNPKTPHTNNNSPEPPPPRKPSKQRTTRKRRTPRRTCSSSPSPKLVSCSCRTTLESVWTKSDSPPQHSSPLSPFDDNSSTESEFPDPEFRTDRVLIPTESFDEMVSLSTSCACKVTPNTTTKDIVIDVDNNSLARKDDKLEGHHEYDDAFSEVELPPIITKPPKFNHPKKKEHKPIKEGSLKIRILKEQQQQQAQQRSSGSFRRFSSHSASSPGVKLRVNSPKIAAAAGRKVHQYSHGRKSVSSTAAGSRRSLSDSFAIVKSSFNPQKDFRESMVEMIVENNIRASKDLEDLLACYLSLNSDEYHDVIIKVFKQIWFDLTETM